MDIKEILFSLSERDAVGTVNEASAYARELLSKYAEVKTVGNLGVVGFIKGKSEYTILLDAHIEVRPLRLHLSGGDPDTNPTSATVTLKKVKDDFVEVFTGKGFVSLQKWNEDLDSYMKNILKICQVTK